jgi:hypothetical protein
MSTQSVFNPKLDFAIERIVDAPARLVWEALTKPDDIPITAIMTMEPVGTGTRYVFTALHRDEADFEKNKTSGFYEGTTIAIGQSWNM